MEQAAHYRRAGNWEWAHYHYRLALESATLAGDAHCAAECTYCLGLYYQHTEQSAQAQACFQLSLELHQALGEQWRSADLRERLAACAQPPER